MAPSRESNEIRIVRVYDAPVQAVWDAWTDPEQVAQWWGPRGFTLTTHRKDLRAGGSWDYTMHGPDGTDFPSTTKYLEVEPLSKLVYDHGSHADRPPLFRVTVLFSDQEGRTKLEMTMTVPTAEAAGNLRKFIKKAGGDSTWDRLAEYVEKRSSGRDLFVIARSFEAPLERMYDMWTDPRHFSRWLPPAGFSMEFLRTEIRTGGTSFYRMQGPGGLTMHGRVSYLTLDRPGRLVYTQQFCDEKERPARHPMSPTWPATLLTTVTLTEEGPDRTRVRVTWEPHGPTSKEELDTFLKARGGMTQGWTGSFDKLEELLPKR